MSQKLAFATFVSVMVMAAFALNAGPAAAGQRLAPAGIGALPGFGMPGLPSVQFGR